MVSRLGIYCYMRKGRGGRKGQLKRNASEAEVVAIEEREQHGAGASDEVWRGQRG